MSKGVLNLFKFATKEADELSTIGHALKFLGRAEKYEKIAAEAAEDEKKLADIAEVSENIAEVSEEALERLEGLKTLAKYSAYDKRLGNIEKDYEEFTKFKKKTDNLNKFKWAKTFTGVGVGLGAVYEAGEYILPTYDEAKRDCQCACQGFNKVNLNEEKWNKLNKILYCRHDADNTPCVLVDDECPATCSLKTNNNKTSSLYGDSDGDLVSSFPSFKDWDGNSQTLCSINEDNEFKDPWHHYHLMRGTELAELGTVAGAGAGAKFGSEIIGGVAGVGAAVAAGEFIPSDFPGHCLYRLFESAEYAQDTISSSAESEHQDLKVVKCIGDGVPDASTGVRKKCNLVDGIIISDPDDSGHTNREMGTCVAWQKSSGGKCIPVTHVPENIYKGLYEEITSSQDINCNILNSDSECNNSEYCYWQSDQQDHFDNIYFCLNDITLINMHNEIVNGEGRHNLINEMYITDEVPDHDNVPGGDMGKIKSLKNYTGDKETDINDICNNYCTDGLCSNLAITTMPLVPGVSATAENLKNTIRLIILFVGTYIIYSSIIIDPIISKFTEIVDKDSNFLKILSIAILMIMLGAVYYYQDKIDDRLKLDDKIEEYILPLVEDNL